MFKDERRVMVWESIRQQGLRPFAKRLSPDLVAQAAEQASVLAGKGPLNLATMSWLGLLSALHLSKNFADILRLGLKLLRDAEDWRATPVAAEVRKARKNLLATRGGVRSTTLGRSIPRRSAREPLRKRASGFR